MNHIEWLCLILIALVALASAAIIYLISRLDNEKTLNRHLTCELAHVRDLNWALQRYHGLVDDE